MDNKEEVKSTISPEEKAIQEEKAKAEKNALFWKKQAELIERWNAVWAKTPEELAQEEEEKRRRKEKRIEEEKNRKPRVAPTYYCEGGSGFGCPKKADWFIFSNTKTLYYKLYLCQKCYEWHHYFNVPQDQLPEGVVIKPVVNPEEVESKEETKAETKTHTPGDENASFEFKATPRAVFLFNGQGAQSPGMTSGVLTLPAVKELYATAKRVLGYDLQKLVLEGPDVKLDQTQHAQPAMLVAGLCALEKLKNEKPEVLNQITATAGLSLGEYTALVFAGVLSVENALKLVKVRGEAMNEAAQRTEGGMLSVFGLDDNQLNKICKQITSVDAKRVCRVANCLYPKGRVVSGHKVLMPELIKLCNNGGAKKCTELKVAGAFHTPLMGPAKEALEAALATIPMTAPRIPIYSNVTGKPFESIAEIRSGLAKQLCEPVQWEKSLNNIFAQGHGKEVYELAPRTQIAAMVKRVNNKIKITSVEV